MQSHKFRKKHKSLNSLFRRLDVDGESLRVSNNHFIALFYFVKSLDFLANLERFGFLLRPAQGHCYLYFF